MEFFLQYFRILFEFKTHMVSQKKSRTFFFSKSKVKKRKNVLMHNFFLNLRFKKNQSHGNGENLQFSSSVPVHARQSTNRSKN